MGWPFRTLATQDVTKDGFELEEYELASSPSAAGHGIRRLHWLRQLSLTLWLWELLSLLTSATCIGAIIVFLAHYDGKPMPSWSYGLTLNSLVSILSSVARSAMLLPIAEVLSQLKWCWFVGRQRPLLDFERFDAASRGPWGSLRVLFNVRLWSLGSLAAALTLATLAIEPCLQQIPTYPTRVVEVSGAKMARSTTYSDTMSTAGDGNGWTLGLGTKGAGYTGLYGSNKTATMYTPTCSTGNCTWPAYTSLAMCHACASHQVYGYPVVSGPGDNTTWWSPTPNLTQQQLFNTTTFVQRNQQYSFIMRPLHNTVLEINNSWSFQRSNNQSVAGVQMMYWPPKSPANDPPSGTFECQLYFCVQTYKGETMNGVFTEKIASAWPAPDERTGSPGPPNSEFLNVPLLQDLRKMANYTLAPPGLPNTTYTVDRATFVALRDWFTVFLGGSSSPGGGSGYKIPTPGYNDDATQIFYNELTGLLGGNMTVDGYTVPMTAGPDRIFNQLASSMTAYMRQMPNSAPAINGTATTVRLFVRARWLWTLQPLSLLALTGALMWGTMRASSRKRLPTWKSSGLAVLLHRLECRMDDILAAKGFDEPDKAVDGYLMRMDSGTAGDWRLTAEKHQSCRKKDDTGRAGRFDIWP